MNPVPNEHVLTVKQVAQYLQVNERTIYRMAVAGKMPAFKIGNTWRIRESDLNAWITEQYSQQ
jgi:excisionase family DNA binding protein